MGVVVEELVGMVEVAMERPRIEIRILIQGKTNKFTSSPFTWRKRAVSMRGARSSCCMEISPLYM